LPLPRPLIIIRQGQQHVTRVAQQEAAVGENNVAAKAG